LSCSDTEAQPGTAGHWSTFFETGEKDLPQTVSKEKVAEIAANFMTTFYHNQIGDLEAGGVSNDAGSILAGRLLRTSR
jgi:hypothetical protein